MVDAIFFTPHDSRLDFQNDFVLGALFQQILRELHVLGQRQFAPLSLGEEVALLCAVADGVLDPVPLDRMNKFRENLATWLAERCPEILALGDEANPLPDAVRTRLKQSLIALAQSVGGRVSQEGSR